jgi:hypothetical protein
MFSIFKRLTRLARSELNNLTDKIGGQEADQDVQEAEENLAEELEEGTASPDMEPFRSRWSKEVREAYAALEIPLGSGQDTIDAAYQAMLKRYHPDHFFGNKDKVVDAKQVRDALGEARDLLADWLKNRDEPKT